MEMSVPTATVQTRSQKVGWGILLVISGLWLLNGINWYFSGPQVTLDYPLGEEGISEADFARDHPVFVEHISLNAREVAIWYAGFGLMAVLVTLEGYRHGTRWAWIAAWVIPAVILVAGLAYGLWIGLGFANVGRAAIGVVALVGQVLARPR